MELLKDDCSKKTYLQKQIRKSIFQKSVIQLTSSKDA